MTAASIRAFRIHNDAAGYRAGVESIPLEALTPGDVSIQVAYSSINYKDALAATGQGKILRHFPLNGGIDVAGHVLESADPKFKEGDAVLCTGCGLSETRDGGYSQIARLQSQWVIPLPTGLGLRESMVLGTAGYTAALALYRMQQNTQSPQLGPIAVNGATGGVGSLAIAIFSKAGYTVSAITGKPEHGDFLRQLGAKEVLGRESIANDKALDTARFGGALDSVGGPMLTSLLAQTVPYGNVASCGLAGSPSFAGTVMPFIIRGVSLLGIASAGSAKSIRDAVWALLGSDWKPASLNAICTKEVSLEQLASAFSPMLAGQSFGRTLVKL